jgi:hypothetical protein
MELDELKGVWQQAGSKPAFQIPAISSLIKKESDHPLLKLKARFKRQMIVVPFALFFVTQSLAKHHHIFQDVLYWYYVAFCLFTIGYFIYSYTLLKSLVSGGATVKETLEKQVSFLEQGLIWRRRVTLAMLALMAILLEVLLYFQQEPSLQKWYAVATPYRVGAYVLVFMSFRGLSYLTFKRRYGRHLQQAKKILVQIN